MILKLLSLLILTLSLLTPENAPDQNDLFITNTNIITLDDETILEQKDIRISDGVISEIGQNLSIPKNSRVVDGTGLYVMPALFDMHAHISYLNPWHQYQLALYPYFGVHHVNIMTGSDGLLDVAGKYNSGAVTPGPTITLASELIDGDPPMWGDDHNGPVLTHPAEVDSVLQALKAKSYRDLKVYNRLSEEVYSSILESAAEMDLRVVGHMPHGLAPNDRLDYRHQRIDHLEGYLELAYDGDLSELPSDYMERRQALMDGYSRDKMKQAAKRTAERGIWNTPTHVLYSSLTDTSYVSEMMEGEFSSLLDPGIVQFWSGPASNPQIMPHLSSEQFRDIHRHMVGALHRAGARILAGTDAPMPVLLFGHSVHQELKYFTEAGMSPYEALKTATVYPAEYLGLEKSGKVLPKYHANLLILRNNPLDNIENTLTIEAMILESEYVTRKELRSEISRIRNNLEEMMNQSGQE